MAPRDMLATASSQGGDAPSWSSYVPVALTAVAVVVALASMYFRKTLLRWAHVLLGLGFAAILAAAIAGVEGADKIAKSLADPVPKDFRELIVLVVFIVVWNLVDNARRRRRDDGNAQGDQEP